MSLIRITASGFAFEGRLEEASAPKTCAAFRRLLPYRERIIHVRWSGEAVWIPLGANHFDLPFEDPTSHPAPGQMILYPGGISEAEILLAYGPCSFASKAGPLAGNPLLTITKGVENLQALGKRTLWQGAQEIVFEGS